MHNKAETRPCSIHFLNMITTQFSTKVKIIRTDNGPEFNMSSHFSSLGIIHQTSCVETPQQNSTVERKHRHLLNVTRALLFQSKLPKSFWSYALCHAVHVINKLPTLVLNHKTPHELLYNTPPIYLDLKVFGCLSFASTLVQNRTKLDPRARKCLFLGYKPGTKGYLMFDLHTRDIFVSRNVIFRESIFPYSTFNTSDTNSSTSDPHDSNYLFLFDHIPIMHDTLHNTDKSGPVSATDTTTTTTVLPTNDSAADNNDPSLRRS